MPDTGLPVEAVIGEVRRALDEGSHGHAVLVAPPGAGKTTVVPLRLLGERWLGPQRIVVLEPRRLAARAAAVRMAELIGEAVGATVGYRTRDEQRTSAATRIEVITEGILVRRLQSDPTLPGTGLVVLDEVHERNLTSDLSLALLLDARSALRPDLRVLAMSATLDADRLATVLGGEHGLAPVVRSDGRQYPVGVTYHPQERRDRLDAHVARVVAGAMGASSGGDVLVFLPGAADIRRVGDRLAASAALPATVDVRPLFGALARDEQDAALAPSGPGRRRVVLATDIAESSLTVAGVRIVIDAGLVRVPRFDPGSGLTRLQTETASRAAADQRAGRAGRLGPGRAHRLWSEADHVRRAAYPVPEILAVDLASFALEVAIWGASTSDLSLLDQPPAAALAEANALLEALGAFDHDARPTVVGRAMADLPLHPRLARVAVAGAGLGEAWTAALVAATLEERDVLRGRPEDRTADLVARVALVAGNHQAESSRRVGHGGRDDRRSDGRVLATTSGAVDRDLGAQEDASRARRSNGDPDQAPVGNVDRQALRTAQRRARELGRRLGTRPGAWRQDLVGPLVALAHPDRIAQQRARGRFRLRGGGGGWLPLTDPLAESDWLAVAGVEPDGADARILTAAAVDEADVRAVAGDRVDVVPEVVWDEARADLRARRQERVGALVLSSIDGRASAGSVTTDALVGLVRNGVVDLPWDPGGRELQARIAFLHDREPERWPDVSDAALLADVEGWLTPFLAGATSRRDIAALNLTSVLKARLGSDRARHAALERDAPMSFAAADGRCVVIGYSTRRPVAQARIQDLFGLVIHPTVLGGRMPVVLELMSPADRLVQVTADLPGFWSGSWAEVRREMAGRYPKHRWPTDPATAAPGRGRRHPDGEPG